MFPETCKSCILYSVITNNKTFISTILGMGQDTGRLGDAASKTLALQHDKDGRLRHDAIARVGHDKDKVCSKNLFEIIFIF